MEYTNEQNIQLEVAETYFTNEQNIQLKVDETYFTNEQNIQLEVAETYFNEHFVKNKNKILNLPLNDMVSGYSFETYYLQVQCKVDVDIYQKAYILSSIENVLGVSIDPELLEFFYRDKNYIKTMELVYYK